MGYYRRTSFKDMSRRQQSRKNAFGLPWMREVIVFLGCFTGVLVINLIGIIQSHSPASELLTRIHLLFFLALAIYGLVIVLRVIYMFVSHLWNRK